METDNQTYADLCDSNVGRSATKLCCCRDHCSKQSRSTIERKFKLRGMTRWVTEVYIHDWMGRDPVQMHDRSVTCRAGYTRNSQAPGPFRPLSLCCSCICVTAIMETK
jgi:hypothetical protein